MADQKISQFTRLSSLDGKEESLVAKGGKNYSFLSGLLAKQEDLDKTNENVTSLQEEVNKLKYGVGYAVSGYKEDDLDPVPYVSLGDVSFLEKGWDFYLIDTTQNTGEEVVPVGKLKRNNLLRFEDGSFAPTVGITEAMRAECDVELYLDAGHQQKYCDAGAFNAETFYNEHGMAKLYNLQGNEVRVLRPWETVETKYTIVKGWMDEAYFIDKVKGNSGIEWSGFLKEKTVWDGVEITDDNRLVPVGISPCPITTVGGKARNFFYLYEGETNCKSSNGQANLCTLFLNDRTYPRTNDVNQNSNRTYARSNKKNYPSYFGILKNTDQYNLLTYIEKKMKLSELTSKIRIDRKMDADNISIKDLKDIIFNIYDYEIRCDSSGQPNWIKCLIGIKEIRKGKPTGKMLAREFHGNYGSIIQFLYKCEKEVGRENFLPLECVEIEDRCGYVFRDSTNLIDYINENEY